MDPAVLAVIVTLGGGALIGAIGYIVRALHGWWVAKQERRAELAARLHGLATLLHTSKSLFDVQVGQRNRLSAMLKSGHPDKVSPGIGYEATFQQMYDHFTAEEAELLLNDSVPRSATALGEVDQVTRRLRTILGRCYGKTGKYLEGERLILAAWKATAERYGEDTWHTRWFAPFLAELYRGWGRPDAAARWERSG